MRKKHFSIYFVILLFLFPFIAAQNSAAGDNNMSVMQNDTLTNDSVNKSINIPDSIPTDSVPQKKNALDAPVAYTAKDSIIFSIGNMGYLYGSGNVKYESIDLTAENITMSMDSSIVTAIYGLDSIGTEFGFPVFKDNDQTVEAKTMRYNFKTKKGYSTNAITQQGEGYIDAERIKRNDDGSFFMCDGKYTTCDDHEHPHFYIMLTKAKVRPKKNVVSGPAYLVIEGLPLKMIGLPFGFFPFSKKYSSGVIMPSYGDEMERGFNLRDGGYYFAINDYVDLALTGEIYTKGSWGLNARSSYKKRYRYSGSLDMGYLVTKLGDKESPDYSVTKDFRISWTHSQDPKANMYRTLSASVNFTSSTYSRNQLNSVYDSQSYTSGTRSSSVTLNQRFPSSPFSLTASMNINQNLRDSTVSITLPNMMISMSRIAPFKRKDAVGKEKWFEKIYFSYSGDFRNSLSTKEDRIFKSSFKEDWIKGMKHSIPVSATFSLFNYLNVSPSFNYNERWYTSGVHQRWDAERNSHVAADTIYGFKRIYDFNFSLAFQTKIYGFFEPLFNVFGIKRIRHVFTPSISFGAQPDFSDSKYGFYESYHYFDQYGDEREYTYSPYSSGMFGTAPKGKSGSISFDFQNNIEAKVKNSNDSLVTKSLIDNLGIRFSYNMVADSLKWSDINVGLRLKLSKSLTINLNATFDPYTYDLDKNGNPVKVDKLRINRYGTIGRLKSTSYSFSPTINQDTFKKWFGKKTDDSGSSDLSSNKLDSEEGDEDEEDEENKPRESLLAKKQDTNEYDEDGYIKNEVKWSISPNYSMGYGYGDFDPDKLEYKGRITHNFNINGSIQPTKNWSFNFSTSYNFDTKKFTYMNCNLSRNLHCWTISASFIPVGPSKSYYVSLRVNSSMLQDLKYEQRGRASSYDPNWY